MGLGSAGIFLPCQHPRQFAHPLILIEQNDVAGGESSTVGGGRVRRLDDPDVPVRVGRNLRQVGDNYHLNMLGKHGKPLADLNRGFSADAGVDFVEDEGRHGVNRGQHDLDGKHDA